MYLQSIPHLNGTRWSSVNWGSAVTSMVTQGSNCQLSMSNVTDEGPGGTSGAHTFTYETQYSLLSVASPGFSCDFCVCACVCVCVCVHIMCIFPNHHFSMLSSLRFSYMDMIQLETVKPREVCYSVLYS